MSMIGKVMKTITVKRFNCERSLLNGIRSIFPNYRNIYLFLFLITSLFLFAQDNCDQKKDLWDETTIAGFDLIIKGENNTDTNLSKSIQTLQVGLSSTVFIQNNTIFYSKRQLNATIIFNDSQKSVKPFAQKQKIFTNVYKISQKRKVRNDIYGFITATPFSSSSESPINHCKSLLTDPLKVSKPSGFSKVITSPILNSYLLLLQDCMGFTFKIALTGYNLTTVVQTNPIKHSCRPPPLVQA